MKRLTVITGCVLFYYSSLAQKLPDIQKEGMRAPAMVKVDGNLEEWGSLSAYNSRLYIYYTIANDDENLYLIIRSNNTLITSKILAGGFTFGVNGVGKKEKNAIAITYPFIDNDDMHAAMMKFAVKGINGDVIRSPAQQQEAEAKLKAGRAGINRQILNLHKFIKVTGITAIADKQIPIYNQTGIKVAAKIDSKGDYLYELAIPLKYLNLTNNTSINYNIKLLAKYWPASLGSGGVIHTRDGGPPLGEGGVDVRSMTVDTDFWGEYVLK